MPISLRQLQFLGFFSCTLLLIIALLLEHFLNLQPCPLCIFQRLIFLIAAVVLLLNIIQKPSATGNMIYGAIILLLSLVGIWAAARQLWLEYHPQLANDFCLPGLSFMLTYLPLKETVKLLLLGQPNCGEVTWRFLGWSIPHWTLLSFILLALLGLWQIFVTHRRQYRC